MTRTIALTCQETVTMVLDDGRFRGAGYFIR